MTNLKIGFRNVNTLSAVKLSILVNELLNTDIIFLSEINKPDFSWLGTQNYKIHQPKEAPRTAALTQNCINLKPIELGISLTQDRKQQDKVVAQTYIYKLVAAKCEIYIENAYITPDINTANLNKVIDHLTEQNKKYRNYLIGGDFNRNFLDKKNIEIFQPTGLKQHIKNITRSASYIRNGKDQTSKTIIDLIFSSHNLQNRLKNPKTTQISIKFDHKMVSIELEDLVSHKYIDKKIQNNITKRPLPNENQLNSINSEIREFKNLESYEDLITETTKVLDKYIPRPQHGFKEIRIYRTPFSRELVKLIREKEKLIKTKHKFSKYFKNLRNKVTKLIRNQKNHFRKKILNDCQNSRDLNTVIKKIGQGFESNFQEKQQFSVEGKQGEDLANGLAEFFKDRAEKLVTDEDIENSNLKNLENNLKILKKLENTLDLIFPKIEKFHDFIKQKNVNNKSGPDGISSALLEKIWDSFSPHLDKIVHKPNFTFPKNQDYFQRVLAKNKNPTKYKDYRPIGILNVIPKYILNRSVFSALKEHLKCILFEKKNFSFTGTHDCIIFTLEKLILDSEFLNLLVKYDFSNAYGTMVHRQILANLNELNVSDKFFMYIQNYLKHQKRTSVILSENEKIYISKSLFFERGGIQGNLGSGELFTTEQLCFLVLLDIFRTYFVDDINDAIKEKSHDLLAKKALENEKFLKDQSTALGFQLNEKKTEYIPFSAAEHELSWNGLWMGPEVRKAKILGFNFKTTKNRKIDTWPETENIISKINQNLKKIHATRTYFPNCLTRVKIARKYIYDCIASLHLILGYSTQEQKEFSKIQIAVNNILRGTGLRNTTPQFELDKVLGTTLKNFARQGLITNGLKNMQYFKLFFDRTDKIRQRVTDNTYMSKFIPEWNLLPGFIRKKLRFAKSLKACKEILKRERTLNYENRIHVEFKWKKY